VAEARRPATATDTAVIWDTPVIWLQPYPDGRQVLFV
jgi:hypothetical protein